MKSARFDNMLMSIIIIFFWLVGQILGAIDHNVIARVVVLMVVMEGRAKRRSKRDWTYFW